MRQNPRDRCFQLTRRWLSFPEAYCAEIIEVAKLERKKGTGELYLTGTETWIIYVPLCNSHRNHINQGDTMPRKPRLVVEGEAAVYHVMSRTVLGTQKDRHFVIDEAFALE